MWGSTAVLLLLLLLSRPRRGGLVILLLMAIITTILVTTTTGAMVDDVNVVAAIVMPIVVVIVEVVDLEDDRGPTLLATTRIGIDVAAVVGEGEGDTAVVALERVIGTSIIVMAILLLVVDIMEDHRIEDHRHHRRTMPESRHMHPNGMQNSQCCVDFFGRRSWRKNRLSIIPR
jgi:hypothetical protein